MYLVLFIGLRNTEKGSPSWFEELLVAPGEHGGNANESARATSHLTITAVLLLHPVRVALRVNYDIDLCLD